MYLFILNINQSFETYSIRKLITGVIFIFGYCTFKNTLPSSLSFSVIPIGSSVFRWNWTNRTLVTFSRLFTWPSRPLWSGSWSLPLRDFWTCYNDIEKNNVVTATFTINRHLGRLWSKIDTFQVGIELCKRATMLILSGMFKNTNESFQMRHCMQFFLQGH